MVISLVRILLVISAILFLQSHYKQPYSPPPESSQPSLPLARDNGKKRRRARRKQKRFDGGGKVMSVQEKKGAKKPPFRLLWLSGAMKQRITDLYDEVLRTTCGNFHLNQVCEFINCLVDARNELLQKSENVQRSFRIKKAMLYNAHNRKSSYDHLRLCEQCRRCINRNRNTKD